MSLLIGLFFQREYIEQLLIESDIQSQGSKRSQQEVISTILGRKLKNKSNVEWWRLEQMNTIHC